LVLTGDAWSALKVCVFKTRADPAKFVLSFAGTEFEDGRLATLKSDLNQTFGIKDTAIEDAERVVKAFADQYGKDNIEVVGHSLGGALAQYAGIKHGVKVTAFNSMGLSVSLRDRLGAEKINEANITHINSSGDPLSQRVEAGRFGMTASSQVGKRYVINVDHKGGHKMENILDGLEKLRLETGPLDVPPDEIQNSF
jgi:pimeloyl-ACP methyl ester carboxylesterase